jgi:predicted TPR repeat methyltransferase
MGAAVRDRVAGLEGADLAPAMIAKAREPGPFTTPSRRATVRRLQNSPQCAFDLILAADALCYFGDLRPVFAGCRRALADDGIFAFTVETFDGVGFRLLESLRFAHASVYVKDTACSAGFRPIFLQRASARREADVEAPGLIGAFAASHGHSRP